jgi:hypothetical protein
MRGARLSSVVVVVCVVLGGVAATADAQECKTLEGHGREIDLPAGWTSERNKMWSSGDDLLHDEGRIFIMPPEPGSCSTITMFDPDGRELPATTNRPNLFGARYSRFWVNRTDDGAIRVSGCIETGYAAVGVQVDTFDDNVDSAVLLAGTEAVADMLLFDMRCAWEPEPVASGSESSGTGTGTATPARIGDVTSMLDVFDAGFRYTMLSSDDPMSDVTDTVTTEIMTTFASKVLVGRVGLGGGYGVDGGWAYMLRMMGGLGGTFGRVTAAAVVGSGMEGVTGSTSLGYAAPITAQLLIGVRVARASHVQLVAEAGWLPFAGKGDFADRPDAATFTFADQGRVGVELVHRRILVGAAIQDLGGATGGMFSLSYVFDPNVAVGASAAK